MIMDRSQKVELAASTDATRPVLGNVNIVNDRTGMIGGTTIEASNGTIVVVVPCKLNSDDVGGQFSADMLRRLRAMKPVVDLMCLKGSKDTLLINLTEKEIIINQKLGLFDVVSKIERKKEEATYPNIGAVIPKKTFANGSARKSVSIYLNAELLLKIQNALGCKGVEISVFEEGDSYSKSPILVEPIDGKKGVGVMMPLRDND